MGETSIEWTDATWNPTVGCSRVSQGCVNCYAERVAHRGMHESHKGLTVLSGHGPRWTGEVRFVPERLAEPLAWKRPRRVFVNSMSDLFHESVTDEQIGAVFGVMAAAERHTFQLLTKRPERARAWFSSIKGDDADVMGRLVVDMGAFYNDIHPEPDTDPFGTATPYGLAMEHVYDVQEWPLPNVWLGVSVEDQATADERIPLLLEMPAAKRFVSYEPALGPVDFDAWLYPTRVAPVSGAMNIDFSAARDVPALDWIIVGGESGPRSRPFDLAWARSTVEACRGTDVACFVKQLGARPLGDWEDLTRGQQAIGTSLRNRDGRFELRGRFENRKGGNMAEWPEDIRVRQFPGEARA